MPFIQSDPIRYFVFDSLSREGVPHAIFTRRGGVSLPPWKSLNFASSVGDDPRRIAENHRLAFQAVDISIDSMCDVWQVQSAIVIRVDYPPDREGEKPKADGMLTNNPQLTLLMRYADCAPIFLYDPKQKVIGQVHAGWRGTVKKIAAVAVSRMQSDFGSKPEDILSAIGPSICVEHYEVGQDVVIEVRKSFGENARKLLPTQDGGVKLNMLAANKFILKQIGVKHIEMSGICTACHLEDWYSHRAEKGKRGAFGAMIGLP